MSMRMKSPLESALAAIRGAIKLQEEDIVAKQEEIDCLVAEMKVFKKGNECLNTARCSLSLLLHMDKEVPEEKRSEGAIEGIHSRVSRDMGRVVSG